MKRNTLLWSLLLFILSSPVLAASFTLESSAFQDNTMIPTQYTCKGRNISPPLSWSHLPENTFSLALIVEDPDAPNGSWTHWVVFNIPTTVTQLAEGAVLPEGAISGKNSWGNAGYQGPCPPLGAHRYVFKLYALNAKLTLPSDTPADAVLQAMTSHVLGTATLTGIYQKEGIQH